MKDQEGGVNWLQRFSFRNYIEHLANIQHTLKSTRAHKGFVTRFTPLQRWLRPGDTSATTGYPLHYDARLLTGPQLRITITATTASSPGRVTTHSRHSSTLQRSPCRDELQLTLGGPYNSHRVLPVTATTDFTSLIE